jgi:succinoglycan biosynthesis transport protein ExoP
MSEKQRPPAKETSKIAPESAFEIDPVRLILRHLPLLVSCVFVGWIVAGVYFLLIPPTYESEADLLLMPKNPAMASGTLQSSQDINTTLSEDLLSTHLMLVQSPTIVKAALEKEGLTELPSLVESMNSKDRTTTDYVIRKLYVSKGGDGKAKKAQVLKIAMRHGNAEDAYKVVDAIVKEFRLFIDKKYADVNQSAAELIDKAQVQLKSDLELAEKEFKQFQENAPLLWNGDKGTNIYRTEFEQIESTLTDLRIERSQLGSRLKMVEEQLEKINASSGSDMQKLALIDGDNSERIRMFLELFAGRAESQQFQSRQPERLEAARGEYEGLLTLKARMKALVLEFGEEQPEVKALREQINTVEEFLTSRADRLKISGGEEILTPKMLVDAYLSLLKNDMNALEDRERLLVAQSKEAEENAKSLVQWELRGESFQLAVDRQKMLFDATVDRLREINLAKDFGGFVNELIKEPELGEEVWPKLSICGALGTLGGMALGLCLALMMELTNKSLRTVKDVETVSGVPNIALIPALESIKDSRTRRAIAKSGSKMSSSLCCYHNPGTVETEIFRGLRTTMFFKSASDDYRLVCATSPRAGDGKSTVLSNLAISMAQAGKRVLLIDADLRRPNVGKLFGVNSNHGLSDLLQGRCSLFDSVISSECERLDLLLAGNMSANPSELLSSKRLKEVLEQAKNEYDFVLVDCPPVLAVSDPCIVSSNTDAVLLIVRLNPYSRSEIETAVEKLKDVNGNLIGTIVNSSDLESSDGRKLDKYGVGYGYSSYGSHSDSYFNDTKPSKETAKAR